MYGKQTSQVNVDEFIKPEYLLSSPFQEIKV